MMEALEKFGRSKIILVVLFCCIILPVIIPLFTSYVPGTADGMAHKFRVVSFGKSTSEGIFRPRWLADQALGYGSPIFLFNYSLPYYIVDGFTRIGFSINRSTQIFEAITLILSFLFMYLLANRLWGKKAGIVAATVYTWAPYHLLSVYLYEGWGEMTSFVYPPLILYLIIKINSSFSLDSTIQNLKFKNQNDKSKSKIFNFILQFCNLHIVLLIIAWSLFILSHNVSALLFTPVILLLALLITKFNLIDWLKVGVLPFVEALILTAFFWLPAISLNHLTNYPDLIAQEQGMRGSYFKSAYTVISVAFTTIKNNTSNFYDFSVGLPILVASVVAAFTIILTAVATLRIKKSNSQKNRFWTSQKDILLTFVVIFLFSLYLANYSSNWLWEAISALRYIVYPFRFLFVATFVGSLIVGYISRKNLILAIIFIVFAIVAGRPYTKPYVDIFPFKDNYFQQPQTIFYAPETKKNMATREFLPKWASIKFLEGEEQTYVEIKKLPEKISLPANSGTVIDVKLNQERINALVNAVQDTTLTLNTFYFPNWIAKIDGIDVSVGKDISGRIVLPVTRGEHKIEFVFGKSRVEKIADVISAGGLTLTLIFIITPILMRRNPRN